MLAEQADVDDLVLERWIQIAIDVDGTMVGDVAVGYVRGGSTAFLGYTLAPEHQGKGYASEAAEAMVDAIFAGTEVHRIVATLDPENFASMRVSSRSGSSSRASTARASSCAASGSTTCASLCCATIERRGSPATAPPPATSSCAEITEDMGPAVFRLRTHRFQRQFVADMATTFIDALIPEDVNGMPAVPWFRAIVADGEVAGFVMVAEPTPVAPEPYLWRLLIDRRHQGRGIGKAALRAARRSAARTRVTRRWRRAGPRRRRARAVLPRLRVRADRRS